MLWSIKAMPSRDSWFSRLGTETPRLSRNVQSRNQNRNQVPESELKKLELWISEMKLWKMNATSVKIWGWIDRSFERDFALFVFPKHWLLVRSFQFLMSVTLKPQCICRYGVAFYWGSFFVTRRDLDFCLFFLRLEFFQTVQKTWSYTSIKLLLMFKN